MKGIILLVLIFTTPVVAYCQQWYQYSDSIIASINRNDLDQAKHFCQLVDKEISRIKIVKDTLYANYIYAKGILNYYESNDCLELLEESLNIWNNSTKIDFKRIVKIHYFLGQSYYALGKKSNNESAYLKSNNHFENCYLISKKYNLPRGYHFTSALYGLILLNFKIFNDRNIVKKYAAEYISLNEETALENFDFNLISVYRMNSDFIGQEKVLQQFLSKYNNGKLNDSKLLYRIYFELVNNNLSQKLKYDNFQYAQEIIKYGERAFNLLKANNLEIDDKLQLIFMALNLSFTQLEDNINAEKYEQLKEKYFPEPGGIDKGKDLKRLLKNEDYKNFKIKFDEYEAELKSIRDFDRLDDIYSISLNLFEMNILFKEDVILSQLNFIKSHKSELSLKGQISFECALVEFYCHTKRNLDEALSICNKNLQVEDINYRLFFYRFKSTIEFLLRIPTSFNTLYKTLELAINAYGENAPRLLQFYLDILAHNEMYKDLNSTKIASKSLKIIHDNKLEETEIAAKVWYYLGVQAKGIGNYVDGIKYLNKCKAILENAKNSTSDSFYILSELELTRLDILLGNFEEAKGKLDFLKTYMEGGGLDSDELQEGYYWGMGDYNFFQGRFVEAKKYYEKCLSFGENVVQMKYMIIHCESAMNIDALKTIRDLEQFQKENDSISWITELIYLLKFNSGDFTSSKILLVHIIERLISENKQYFHLLSDYERSRLYIGYSRYFEYLNTFLLLDSSENFVHQYVDFRFYSKSLLFSNSFIGNSNIQKDKELYSEFKENTIEINSLVESKHNDTDRLEVLKTRNREIEKLLSINANPLTVPTINDLNKKLTKNMAFVEIVRINKQSRKARITPTIENEFTDSISYGAIIIRKDIAPKFIIIDGSNLLENQYYINFKNKIKNKEEDTVSYWLLWEKIETELKNIEDIYLVTDGVYNSINVESIYNPIKGQYVIDYLYIHQIQSIRTITDEKEKFNITSTSKVTMFGNPDFSLALKTSNDNILQLGNIDSTLLNKIRGGVNIKNLEGTENEMASINTILTDAKIPVELYTYDSATEDNLKKIQSPDILHIATHGYFLNQEHSSKVKNILSELYGKNDVVDPYLKSGLLLAGAQKTLNGEKVDGFNNGILTAEEAKSLDLKETNLVVLSACETGLGDNLVGEGVIGLQRAFMIAGAKSVLMSLWSVSDEKTEKLMTLFYSKWINNKMSKEDAFYQAKMEIKKLYPQPYYWAGFILLE